MKRILLIDDSAVIQVAARHALTEAGYEVATRSTFHELMSQPIEGFDLILMDVQMPELYGDDVAMVLRVERGVLTPIDRFSTLDASDLAERAAAARVDGYISKSLGMDHVIERVNAIFGAA